MLPVTFDSVLRMLEAGELSLQETRGLGFFFFPPYLGKDGLYPRLKTFLGYKRGS